MSKRTWTTSRRILIMHFAFNLHYVLKKNIKIYPKILYIFPFVYEYNCWAEIYNPENLWQKSLLLCLYLKLADHTQKIYKHSLKCLNTIFALIWKIKCNTIFYIKHCRELNMIISAPIISYQVKDKHLKQKILTYTNTKQRVTIFQQHPKAA